MEQRYQTALSSAQPLGAPWLQEAAPSVNDEPLAQKEEGIPLTFKTWEGEDVHVVGQEGESLMDLGKRLELGSIEGVCGGVLEVCSCLESLFLAEPPP